MLTLPAQLLGILTSLGAAAAWGGGDFTGGYVTRRMHPIFTLALNASVGLAAGLLLAWLRRESAISWSDAAWAAFAGIAGGLGLMCLYRGLSLGSAAIVSPVAAVVGAVIPVLAGAILEGLPSLTQMAGFALGIAGIWQVTRLPGGESASPQRSTWREAPTWLALAAGTGFGFFFILLAQVSTRQVFAPLAATKGVQVLFALALIGFLRLKTGSRQGVPLGLLAGLLDAAGNTFYLIAQSLTRLDVAAVLVSMYPVGTVLLSRLLLKEQISGGQWLGAALCVGAVGLIAL